MDPYVLFSIGPYQCRSKVVGKGSLSNMILFAWIIFEINVAFKIPPSLYKKKKKKENKGKTDDSNECFKVTFD